MFPYQSFEKGDTDPTTRPYHDFGGLVWDKEKDNAPRCIAGCFSTLFAFYFFFFCATSGTLHSLPAKNCEDTCSLSRGHDQNQNLANLPQNLMSPRVSPDA
jgi:hypothetical protein